MTVIAIHESNIVSLSSISIARTVIKTNISRLNVFHIIENALEGSHNLCAIDSVVMCSKFHLDLTKETFLDQRNTELLVPDEGECVLNRVKSC